MDLRPRKRKSFSGFTNGEIEKMEQLFKDDAERSFDQEFCKKLARVFNRSKGRAGKPIVKWTEIENWFQNRQQCNLSQDTSSDNPRKLADSTETCPLNKANENSEAPKGETVQNPSEMEFEARSATDGAWYDIEKFIAHRFLSSGEALSGFTPFETFPFYEDLSIFQSRSHNIHDASFDYLEDANLPQNATEEFLFWLGVYGLIRSSLLQEVLVRFIGFGPEEDEWVNVKRAVRERSISLENSECNLVKVGEYVLCFQERKYQARYYEAHVVDIERRLHDIRGCRCLFTIRYDHDNTQEKVHLSRLCFRPCILGHSGENEKESS